MQDSNKHTTEATVRQVGYLPELYEDARSEKNKILCFGLQYTVNAYKQTVIRCSHFSTALYTPQRNVPLNILCSLLHFPSHFAT